MTETAGKIAIVHGRSAPRFHATELADQLQKRGFAAELVPENSAAISYCDKVVLLGAQKPDLDALADASDQANARQIVAWVTEPIMPAHTAIWAWLYGRLLDQLESILPFGAKTRRRLTRFLYWPISLWGLAQNSGQLSAKDVQAAMTYSIYLRTAVKAGLISHVLAASYERVDALAAMGINAEFAPMGHHPTFGHDLGLDRDIDVLFLGRLGLGKRRLSMMRIFRKLRALGLNVDYRSHGTWGDDRTKLLNRTKVVLHLPKYPWDTPWYRWLLATANGAIVASPPMSIPKPFRPGEDFLCATENELASEIFACLEAPSARQNILENCRSAIDAHLNLGETVDLIARRLQLESWGIGIQLTEPAAHTGSCSERAESQANFDH